MRGSQKTDGGWFEDLKAHVSERWLWSSLASEPMDHFLGTPFLPIQIGHTLSRGAPWSLGGFQRPHAQEHPVNGSLRMQLISGARNYSPTISQISLLVRIPWRSP